MIRHLTMKDFRSFFFKICCWNYNSERNAQMQYIIDEIMKSKEQIECT